MWTARFGPSFSVPSNHLANLRAALAFLRLPATERELQLLHRWLDTWTGVGLITVGVRAPALPAVAEPHRRGRVAGTVHEPSDHLSVGLRCGTDAVEGGAVRGVDGAEATRRGLAGHSSRSAVPCPIGRST
jgi:hypothetical protein